MLPAGERSSQRLQGKSVSGRALLWLEADCSCFERPVLSSCPCCLACFSPQIDSPGCGLGAAAPLGSRGHIAGKPVDRPYHHVLAVAGIGEAVAFIGINHELRRHMLVAERMPELEGLGRRALAVAVAN